MVTARGTAWVLAGLALAAATEARAGTLSYTAQLDRAEVTAEEPFNLVINITADGNDAVQELVLPDVSGLRVVGNNRSEGTSVQIGPGGTSFKRTIRIIMALVADRAGRYVIGRGRVKTARESAQSDVIQLRVNGPSSRGPPAPRAADVPPDEPLPAAPAVPGATDVRPTPAMLKAGIFATLEADRGQVMLGEQVTLTVRLFSRSDLSDIDALRLPKLEGFWSEVVENPQRITPTLMTVEGQRYQAYLLRRIAAFPTRAGEFELAPVEADVVTGGGFLSPGRRHRVQSLPLTLVVDPLPAEGQPPGFQAGNVGRFTLDARLDRKRTTLSEPATLTVRIQGTGNLRQAAVPRVEDTADLRVYDPTPSEDIRISGNRFQGFKQLEFLVQPKRAGALALPRITFPFYDTDARRYVTLTAPPLALDVVGDGDKTAPGPAKGPGIGAGARPLRTDPELRARALPALLELPEPAAWIGLPSLLALGSLAVGGFVRRRRERAAGDASLKARVATRHLLEAVQGGARPGDVNAGLHAYLVARLGPEVGGLTRAELQERLGARGVHADDATRLARVMDALDAARYAPENHADGHTLASETVAVVRTLEAALGGSA
ncbi:MAG: protein BatD [Deltaproteobacteria bacterium]|nr:protein BatD [Deltaproteobacteria bacterium]